MKYFSYALRTSFLVVSGKSLTFTILVDVFPEVPLEEAKYKGLIVEVPDVEFNQEAYDKALFKL